MVSLAWKKIKTFTSPIGQAQGWFHFSETKFNSAWTSDYLLISKTEILKMDFSWQIICENYKSNGLRSVKDEVVAWVWKTARETTMPVEPWSVVKSERWRFLLKCEKQRCNLSSVYTRRDIVARYRGVMSCAMDAENGLQRNQQGRLH